MSVKNLRRVSCVAAIASNLGIGNNGKLPWPSLRSVEFWEQNTRPTYLHVAVCFVERGI